MLTLTATFDHRYVDGYHAAKFAAAVREYFVDPAAFEKLPPVERAAKVQRLSGPMSVREGLEALISSRPDAVALVLESPTRSGAT
jgi:hypothetical protein